MLNRPFGSKLTTISGKGFLYLLRPTPDLWTRCLPHRTQILYLPDISFISLKLGLKPGVWVVESGTGSGSFTHALCRTVRGQGMGEGGREGKVFTFEFHPERVLQAEKEFKEHGMEDVVAIQHRDVCRDGFGDDLEGKVDVVFLDLPAPWDAIAHAKSVMRVRYTPCIEQVQRTCSTLAQLGFSDICMFECLETPWDVQAPAPKAPTVEEEAAKARDIRRRHIEEQQRNRMRQLQRRGVQKDASEDDTVTPMEVDQVQTAPESIAQVDSTQGDNEIQETNEVGQMVGRGMKRGRDFKWVGKKAFQEYSDSVITAVPERDLKAHTSYLTFAVLEPMLIEEAR